MTLRCDTAVNVPLPLCAAPLLFTAVLSCVPLPFSAVNDDRCRPDCSARAAKMRLEARTRHQRDRKSERECWLVLFGTHDVGGLMGRKLCCWNRVDAQPQLRNYARHDRGSSNRSFVKIHAPVFPPPARAVLALVPLPIYPDASSGRALSCLLPQLPPLPLLLRSRRSKGRPCPSGCWRKH